jgi:TAT (twin-arginine translocation) pathway signal sequence
MNRREFLASSAATTALVAGPPCWLKAHRRSGLDETGLPERAKR